eukprot:s1042_g3.t1
MNHRKITQQLKELLIEKLGASLPAGWATMTADSTSVRKELVTDQEVLDRIQSMVDHTFRTWGSIAVTRDRRGSAVDGGRLCGSTQRLESNQWLGEPCKLSK